MNTSHTAPILSVIVPVYRVERTLDRCVQSIVQQQVTGMEIILVDDGSPDNCPTLCDKWAEQDNRIRVIHKANGGLSDARNAGIAKAQGQLLTFVDSDDYLSPDTYAPLIAFMQQHPEINIVEYPVCVYEGSPQEYRFQPTKTCYTMAETYWRQTAGWAHTYAWNKVYRSFLFLHIHFPKGKVFEDMHTIPHLLCQAQTIATLPIGEYHYCHNTEGITACANADAYRSLLEAHIHTLSLPRLNVLNDERYRLVLLNIQICTHELSGDKPLIPWIPFRQILTLKTILYNILGPNILCHINRIFRNIIKRKKT